MTTRGRAALRIVATLLLVTAALVARTRPRPFAAEPGLPARSVSSTPFLSVRRVPQLLVDGAGAQRLRADLAALLAPLGGGACAAADNQGGEIARYQANRSLAPASTEKLLTGAAALSQLGPGHRFKTRAVTSASMSGGVLTGDVYLVGGGDPVLSTPGYVAYLHGQPRTRTDPVTALSDLAAGIVAAGVTRVEGAILGDDSRHDQLRYLPGWKPSYRTEGEVGPLGALEVNDGFVSWSGRVGAEDPAVHAAGQLVALLDQSGVGVSGGSGRGTAPIGAREIASVSSPPLSEIVAGMLTSSDNLTAEVLTRELGVATAGRGSTEAGTAAITSDLRRLAVPVDGVSLTDGSGLAPSDRATCIALLRALRLGDRPRLAALREGLADAGESGTLALRFGGDPLRGRLHAKTGQIAGVAGLAGVIDPPAASDSGAGGTLFFAVIVNGDFTTGEGQSYQEQVAHLVAEYPNAPAARDLVPRP